MSDTALRSPNVSTRSLYAASWAVGSALYGVLIVAGYPLVGVGAFVVGAVAAVALDQGSNRPISDERDRAVFDEAGRHTIAAVGMASAVVFPTMVALRALDYTTWPTWLYYAGYFVAGLFAVWGVFVLLAQRRR
ncbi:MAG: DUF2178 domain-containing protein [Haloglomus sp.]